MRASKANKDRNTIYSSKTVGILKKYYLICRPKVFLFECKSGRKYSRISVAKVLEKAVKRDIILKYVTIHTLRHFFVTLC